MNERFGLLTEIENRVAPAMQTFLSNASSVLGTQYTYRYSRQQETQNCYRLCFCGEKRGSNVPFMVAITVWLPDRVNTYNINCMYEVMDCNFNKHKNPHSCLKQDKQEYSGTMSDTEIAIRITNFVQTQILDDLGKYLNALAWNVAKVYDFYMKMLNNTVGGLFVQRHPNARVQYIPRQEELSLANGEIKADIASATGTINAGFVSIMYPDRNYVIPIMYELTVGYLGGRYFDTNGVCHPIFYVRNNSTDFIHLYTAGQQKVKKLKVGLGASKITHLYNASMNCNVGDNAAWYSDIVKRVDKVAQVIK